MNYQALLLDIDGVLLDKEDDTLPETWLALNKLTDYKIPVAFVTARPYGLTSHLIKKLNNRGTHVLDNGAFIYNPLDKISYYDNKIDKKITISILGDVYAKSSRARIGVSNGTCFYGNHKYYRNLKNYMPSQDIFLYDQKSYEANSIWVRDLDEDLTYEIESKFKKKTNIYQYIQHEGLHSLFVHHLSVDKAEGVKKLAKVLNIELSKCIFIGDDLRDIPTLKLVGMPVCPSNACHEVISVCKYVAKFEFSRSILDIIGNLF